MKIIDENKKKAQKLFESLNLPSNNQEDWKYTDTSKIPIINLKKSIQQIEYFGLDKKFKEKGVIFTDINTAINLHFNKIKNYLPNSLIKNSKDKFNEMHGARWNDGIFIFIPKNTILKIPLKNIFTTNDNGAVFSHSIIILEENSSLDYIEEHISTDFKDICLRNDAVEIYLNQNSRLNYHNLQRWNKNIINLCNWKTDIKKDSYVEYIFGQFGGKMSRLHIDNIFSDQGGQAIINGIFHGDQNQHFDITTNSFHKVPNTTSNILVKGVLNDASSAVYRGKIKINKNAQNTNSYLSDHTLIMGDDAVSNSIPSLEIDAHEVSASHGATIGRPNDDEIFYLMARGLNKNQAERLIIQGYFSPIIEKIKIEKFKEKFNFSIKE